MAEVKDLTHDERKSRIVEIKTALKGCEEKINGVVAAFKIEDGGGVVVTPEMRDEFGKARAEAKTLREALDMLEASDELSAYLDAPEGKSIAVTDAAALLRQMQEQGGAAAVKTLGELFTESDVFTEMKAAGRITTLRPFTTEGDVRAFIGASFGQKDIYTARGGTFSPPAFGRDAEIIERALRTSRVRDLFPADQTTQNLIEYIRITGFTNQARMVPERENADGSANPGGAVFGLKKKSDMSFTAQQAPVRTIAHTLDVHKNVLDDEPRLRSTIDREMLYGLRLIEDDQILNGDGTGENLLGILNTPGVQSYAQADRAGDKKSAAVRRAATRVLLANYEATAVVFHPLNWEDIELEEDNNGAFRVALSVAVGAEKRIWRLAVVDTPAIAEDTFLVGSFGLGAKVWDRRQATVEISTENRDNFERNAVTIRAEERLALEVARPESFVVGEFTPVAA